MSNIKSGAPQDPSSPHKFIIKSTSVLSLGTLSSRILGFWRDLIVARLLGTGMRADAFFVALKIPNLFRELVAEGATNSAVVPVLSEYVQKKSKAEVVNFVSIIFAIAAVVLSLITILGIIFSPIIVRMVAPGFGADPEKLQLTVTLTRLMFPYLILIGLAAHTMAVLYTFKSFKVPAFTPCLLNISVIASAFFISAETKEPTIILAIGVLLGGVLQLAFHIPVLMKMGISWIKPASLRHPGVEKIGKLLVPRVLGGGVYQLNVFVDTVCASLSGIVGIGGVSAIYYANRIIQVPMGVFGVSLASAVLPTFASLVSKQDMPGFRKTFLFALENILFIMCPTSIILMFLSQPMIKVLFERGEFDAYSTQITGDALFYTALGLFSFGAVKILVTAFYSLQDTRTPLKVAIVSLLVNAFLNLVLMGPMKVGGIALSSTVAGTVNFLSLFYVLNRRIGKLAEPLLEFLGKIIVASLLTVAFEYIFLNFISRSSYFPAGNWGEIIKLTLTGSLGFVVYLIVCVMLRIKQAEKFWGWMSFREKL